MGRFTKEPVGVSTIIIDINIKSSKKLKDQIVVDIELNNNLLE
jgi:hypothetical protein